MLGSFIDIGQFTITVQELAAYSATVEGMDLSAFTVNWAGSLTVEYEFTPAVVPIPEPSILSLLAFGLISLVWLRRPIPSRITGR
jgi:hypothetical protein